MSRIVGRQRSASQVDTMLLTDRGIINDGDASLAGLVAAGFTNTPADQPVQTADAPRILALCEAARLSCLTGNSEQPSDRWALCKSSQPAHKTIRGGSLEQKTTIRYELATSPLWGLSQGGVVCLHLFNFLTSSIIWGSWEANALG